MLLACHNLNKSFDAQPVLMGGYFHLEEKEKAAMVGINGAGKSTLLNLISGELSPDDGSIVLVKGARLGYLKQYQGLDSDESIYDELAQARADLLKTEKRLRDLEVSMAGAEGQKLENLMEEYSRLSHLFESEGGYALRSEITGILKGLGFSEADFDRPCRVLSGGEKTRLALGRLLISKPDLLLLDEPTNHLDIASVAWLEGFLKEYPGAVLLVSHDRYFMDRLVTRIIEVEQGQYRMFEGNYSRYAEKKAQERAIALKQYQNQQQMIRHQEEVIAKLRSFNREKSIKRAESREKQLAKVERLEKPQEIRDAMHLSLKSAGSSGQQVLEVSGLSQRFGTRQLFEDLAFSLRRGEKAALIGENGSGKTTILKAVMGQLSPDKGEIRFGAQVVSGYYDQEQHSFNETNTLFDEIRENYPKMNDTQVRNHLAAFLFQGDDVFKPVSALSGGERARLSLAKLMLSPCNFLILDEPTNHLDITSREILEEALLKFDGSLLFVSHDRYFINRLAGRILELSGSRLTEYAGNYDYYLEKKAQLREEGLIPSGRTGAAALSEAAKDWRSKKEAEAKRRKKENDLKRCEECIEETESALAELEKRMADPAVATDPARLMEMDKEAQALKDTLNDLYEQWEALSD